MNEDVKAAVLRRSHDGFAEVRFCSSTGTGLGRWRRFVNWVAFRLRADQPTFIDPENFKRVKAVPQSAVADPSLLDEAMRELSPTPLCRLCGNGWLVPDPAGHYCHAERHDGAPLLCQHCAKAQDKGRK